MRAACAVLVCAFAAAACDGSNFPSSPTPKNPAGSVGVIAPASVTATSFACNGSGTLRSNVDVLVSALRSTVFLDSVTLQLIDGTNLSANSVTFPRASLDADFGSTRIVLGSNRTFGLRPQFACGVPPQGLRADLILIDEHGDRIAVSAITGVR